MASDWRQMSDFFNQQATCPKGMCTATAMHTNIMSFVSGKLRKMDPLYRHMYPLFTGSAYEKTKIGDNIEFDVMMVVNRGDLRIVPDKNNPGWATVMPAKGSEKVFAKITKNGYICPAKVNQKYFGDLQKCINKDPLLKEAIVFRKHGVAAQQDFHTNGKMIYSVDIVFCFEQTQGTYPHYEYVRYVPKPNAGLDPDCTGTTWRRSYSEEERDHLRYIDRYGDKRQCLRILKAVRHNDDTLKSLTSYHLKTALMHVDEHNPRVRWHRHTMGERVDDVFQKLETTLRNGNLPHFFDGRINLLDGMDSRTRTHMADRLNRLRTNPNERKKFFEKRNPKLLPNSQALNQLYTLKMMKISGYLQSQGAVESAGCDFTTQLFERFSQNY